MITLLLVCSIVKVDGYAKINLASGNTIEARYRSSYSPQGDVVGITVTQGKLVSELFIQMPQDCWVDADIEARPVLMLSPSVRNSEAILDLTVPIESGVYGYRRVSSYSINIEDKVLLRPVGRPIEFSDFGSWRRLDHGTIELWDSIWDESLAHQAPHRYSLTRISQGTNGNMVLSVTKTAKTYAYDWYSDPQAPSIIPAELDPLRELGSRWTWWGEPHLKDHRK